MAIARRTLQRTANPSVAAVLLLLAGGVWVHAYLTVAQPALAARIFPSFTLVATCAIVAGIVVNRPAARAGWGWLAAGMALWTVGDAAWGWTMSARGFPSLADAFYLTGYACFSMMLHRLTTRAGTFDAGRFLDSLIAGVGFGVLVWSYSIEPALEAPVLLWAAVINPAFDIAILVAMLPSLVHHRHSPSAWLLGGGFALFLLSDAQYGAAARTGTLMTGTLGDAGWLLGYVALGAAALHPSMASIAPFVEQAPGRRIWLRTVLLACAVLILPAAAAARPLIGRGPDLGLALAASSFMAVLVMARLHLTLREVVRREDRFHAFMQQPGIGAFIKDRAGRYAYLSDGIARLNGLGAMDWHGRTDAELLDPGRAARYARIDAEVRRSGRRVSHEERLDGPDGPRWVHVETFPLRPASGSIGALAVDITERVHAEAEARRLAAAVEQAQDSIVITDRAGTIEYVNPAFEAFSGYTRDELIGQNPRILKSDRHNEAFYRAMWATLLAGQPWEAEFVNRTKSGALLIDQQSISPIRDETGAITHFVAVHHDVTRERERETRDARLQRERMLISETIRQITPGSTPEETAQAVCRQIVSLSGAATADFMLFGLHGRTASLAFTVAAGQPPPLSIIPLHRARQLRRRAAEGPWVEQWVDRPWHPYNATFRSAGVKGVGYAPVHAAGALIGLLAVTSAADDAVALLTEDLPSIAEFAALAGALVGPAVAERTELSRVRTSVDRIIATQAFHPVFQPIVDLERGITVGYEALTRFDDGVAAEVRFAEASAVGLGVQLEAVTLRRAIEASERLPRAALLSVNVSPELIRSGQLPAPTGRHRSLVLEVTEHAVISDYAELLGIAGTLGPRVVLAVDDAGAGFASLHHVVELRPKFVKLDRSLIAGIDADPARRALAAGMVHFARQVGGYIIAEGVETAEELATLRAVGIRLAQGYLLGRPIEAS
jgi:PAS domain S-box-containing protein